MIVKLRLEAEGKTLKEVVSAIETARKQLPPSCDKLEIHDEHYERGGDQSFRGRCILGRGPKRRTAVGASPIQTSSSGSNVTFYAGGAA